MGVGRTSPVGVARSNTAESLIRTDSKTPSEDKGERGWVVRMVLRVHWKRNNAFAVLDELRKKRGGDRGKVGSAEGPARSTLKSLTSRNLPRPPLSAIKLGGVPRG